MPPLGQSAQGSLVGRSPDPFWPDGAPQGGTITFTTIAELRNLTYPNLTKNALETTTHNELDDAYVAGIRRHGELTFQVNFVPENATHDHLTGLQKSWFDGARDVWRISSPPSLPGVHWLFSGFVIGFAPVANVDEVYVADVTVRPTGRHDWILT